MNAPFQGFDKEVPFAQPRRRLPHRTQTGCTYFVTWRLEDSVPKDVLKRWKAEREEFHRLHPKPWDRSTQRAYDERLQRRMERWADAGRGACHLRNSQLRQCVSDEFHRHEGQYYNLDCFVIMPNHVHALVRPFTGSECAAFQCDAELQPAELQRPKDAPQGESQPSIDNPNEWSLSWILKHWKGASSRAINKSLGRRGSLWMDESFDHAVRSDRQLERFRDYIRENPRKATLKDGEFALWPA